MEVNPKTSITSNYNTYFNRPIYVIKFLLFDLVLIMTGSDTNWCSTVLIKLAILGLRMTSNFNTMLVTFQLLL